MSLETRLATFISAVGADIKALQARSPSSEWTEQRLTATYSNATIAGTDVFSGFTPVASKRYHVEALLNVQSSAAASGVQTSLLGPTTGITRAGVRIKAALTATTEKVDYLSALNAYQVTTTGVVTATLIQLQAIIEVSPSPGAGPIRVGARAEVAAVNAVQIFPGSHMRWRELA